MVRGGENHRNGEDVMDDKRIRYVKEQFTAHDSLLHPEIAHNKAYLDFTNTKTRLSSACVAYGYQKQTQNDADGWEYQWITRAGYEKATNNKP